MWKDSSQGPRPGLFPFSGGGLEDLVVPAARGLAFLLGSNRETTGRNMDAVYGNLIKLLETPENYTEIKKFTDPFGSTLSHSYGSGGSPSWDLLLYRDPLGHMLAGYLAPAMGRTNDEYLKMFVNLRAMRPVIAVRQFQAEKDRLPISLQELVPGYIEEIPDDPFDGMPLRYICRKDGRWMIYSVGPDGVDDGGKYRPEDRYPGRHGHPDKIFPSTAFEEEKRRRNGSKGHIPG